MKTSIIGYPRIGEKRELKKLIESYFKGEITKEELKNESKILRKNKLEFLRNQGIDYITVNDFSYYDIFLDTSYMLNIIDKKYIDLNFDEIDTKFAMAKGYQKNNLDVKALEMKKWYNTNYHYIVPEITDNTEFKLNSNKIIDEYKESDELNIKSKPLIIGPFTFLKLSKIKNNKDYSFYINDIINVYKNIFKKLNENEVIFLQIDEPEIVRDLSKEDIKNFINIYEKLLKSKDNLKIILQTYFGDVRDIYKDLVKLDFYGIGLDFNEGEENLNLIDKYGFPKNIKLFAGVVNGKNIWKNNYKKTIDIFNRLKEKIKLENIIINTSCSLLHVPYTLRYEEKMDEKYKEHLAFAEEKINEIIEIKDILSGDNYENNYFYIKNKEIIEKKKNNSKYTDIELQKKIDDLTEKDFERKSIFEERQIKQHKVLDINVLPTTTIGSFPQTAAVRKLRRQYKKGEISEVTYKNKIKDKIKNIIKIQEDIGLDILVHGEYERNDMVEYFGENLEGFIFTQNGWVQSYGTRGVKPPIIFSDIKRKKQITIDWIKYAQSLTKKPVKGMLTGPVTILNWSFPRDDINRETIAYQIALAIKEEVKDLEKSGIKIIQIDEAALREKLPLRKIDWENKYLNWAVKSFKLTTSSVDDKTQIHTHMCYSDFNDILKSINSLDADVISIESARSDLKMLQTLKEFGYKKEIGPGVYDIHSSRIPSESEFINTINKIVKILGYKNIWINPDCGLKTRKDEEAVSSLKNMINAVKKIRKNISQEI